MVERREGGGLAVVVHVVWFELAGTAAWVACYRRGVFEAYEGGGVDDLRRGVACFGAAIGLGHVAALAPAGAAVFVEGEGVNGLAAGGLWLGAEVEDPDDLEMG